MELTDADRRMLEGGDGEAIALAMRLLVTLGELQDAERLIPVTSVHVDGCLYHGQAGLDFARRLADAGARVVVPTTLNVSSLDLLHPDLYRGDPETAAQARALMDAYVAMGCHATWTCAPYQLRQRPGLGEHVAWAESNAIVFANSVLGARTERYGDFIDICAALTGRVPAAGLHLDGARGGEVLVDVRAVPHRLLADPIAYALIGHAVGGLVGTRIPVIDGLPSTVTEDDLKAVGAAAASSGAVAMFHAVGVTPEAPTLGVAFRGCEPTERIALTGAGLRAARDELTTSTAGEIVAVSVGTPHFSLAEFERLAALVPAGTRFAVPFYVNTGRDVLAEARRAGLLGPLEAAGVQPVVDTCTYITPILDVDDGPVMTNSGKWAYYAPGNLGVDVVLGSLSECVASARDGRVRVDGGLFGA